MRWKKWIEFFLPFNSTGTQAYQMKLMGYRFRIVKRNHAFSREVIKLWNLKCALPVHIMMAVSTHFFKRELNRCREDRSSHGVAIEWPYSKVTSL